MSGQYYNWTCSVCSATWVLQSTWTIDPQRDQYDAREEVGLVIGYPNCVNETYGCMSADCIIRGFDYYGYAAQQAWVNFDQAYAIMSHTTGVINPTGMYHFMGIRGVKDGNLWVANSAQGYDGVYDTLNRNQFNSLGPVQIVYLEP